MRVDFYVLASAELADKQRYACLLANKAYGQGLTVAIRAVDGAQSDALDKLLWTFADNSFVPHIAHRAGDAAADWARYAVQISCPATQSTPESAPESAPESVNPAPQTSPADVLIFAHPGGGGGLR